MSLVRALVAIADTGTPPQQIAAGAAAHISPDGTAPTDAEPPLALAGFLDLV
jgi:hypothetical protein